MSICANDPDGESQTLLRYFFIENRIIHIYDAYCYDDGCSLDETFRVVVKPGGEVEVDEVGR